MVYFFLSSKKCQGITLKGKKCKNTGACRYHSRSAPSPRTKKHGRSSAEIYFEMEDEIWHDKTSRSVQEMLDVIKNYVTYLNSSPTEKWLAAEIKKAPKLTTLRAYDFEPGTGKGSRQFYKFARAIENGEITSKNITKEKLEVVIKSYLFDRIE